MSKYELTVVISGKATPAKQKSVIEKVNKFIETFKGKIESTDEWGKIGLMYKIKGNDHGIFIFFNIELDSGSVKKFDDKLKGEEDVIRFLLVKSEKVKG